MLSLADHVLFYTALVTMGMEYLTSFSQIINYILGAKLLLEVA